jgi:hypothetical protein
MDAEGKSEDEIRKAVLAKMKASAKAHGVIWEEVRVEDLKRLHKSRERSTPY